LLHNLNAELGKGKGGDISFEDVYLEIDKGSLFPFLEQRLGPMPAVSQLRPEDDEQADYFIAAMRGLAGYNGNEDKFALSDTVKNGVCLVVALIVELISQGHWDIGSVHIAPDPGLDTPEW
jgi:hypothetical protein